MTFATEDRNRYVVVQRDGTDTLHINPREECNTDDAGNVQTIDRRTAEAYARSIAHNSEVEVAFCRHCVSLSWFDLIVADVAPVAGRVVDEAVVSTPEDQYVIGHASDGVDSHLPYVVQEDPDAEAILQHRGHEYRVPVTDAKPRRKGIGTGYSKEYRGLTDDPGVRREMFGEEG